MRLRTATGIALIWTMGIVWVASTSGQAQQAGPQRAEEVFKNIQVLRGIPVDEFMDTMGIMSAALGFDCAECYLA